MKRLLMSLLLGVLLLAMALPAAAVEATVGATSTLTQFAAQDVMKDLNSAGIGGKPFSVGAYPHIPGATDQNTLAGEKPQLQILSLTEYGYSKFTPIMRRYGDYSLWLYIYNPSNANMQWQDARNSVTISFGNRAEYNKYSLKFCSAGGDGQGHDSLYIKYRVDISADELRDLVGTAEERLYTVSEFEIVTDAATANATSYKVGGRYVYSGYMAGYGVSQSTLASTVKDQITIDLECHDVVYRTDKNAADDGLKNQLNSVYFAIPNDILEEYGGIVGARFGYYEYDSGSIYGVNTQTGYDVLKPYENVTLEGQYSYSDLPHLYAGVEGHTLTGFTYYWVYNMLMNDFWVLSSSFRYEDTLSYVFQYTAGANADQIIDSGVREQFDAWWSSYNRGETDPFFSRQEKPAYTVRDLDNRKDEDWYQINSFDGNWIQQLFGMESGYSADSLAPIVTVSRGDLNDVENNLKVASYYADELANAVTAAESADATVHLLRFADSTYFSMESKCTSAPGTNTDYEGIVVQERLYMDFDILSLTFSKDGKDMILPVAGSPINAVADLETPSLTLWDRTFGGEGTTEDKILFYVALVIAVIILLQLLAVVFPILQPALNLLYKLLLLPFKLIVQIISRIVEKIRRRR